MDDDNRRSKIPEISGEFFVARRNELLKEIGDIDAEVIMQFGTQVATRVPNNWFSDWPDTFNNGGTWYKTWGKGGEKVFDPPIDVDRLSFGYTISIFFRKVKSLIFGKSK